MVVIAKHRELLEKLGLAKLDGVKKFQGEVVKSHGKHERRRDIFKISAKDSSGAAVVLFLKRNWKPYKKDGLASLFSHGKVWSQSRVEWENSCALQKAGLQTGGLAAYGEKCGLLWENFSFLITESATGETLDQFIRNCADKKLRRRVFDLLAKEIRKLHDAGLATPDLFTRHIFVEDKNGAPSFQFIDMARLDRRGKISDGLRVRDLAALNITAPIKFVSAKERMRFLKIYSEAVNKKFIWRIHARMEHLLDRKKFRSFAD